ncbi:hypothetical protein [Geodermatophilus sp. URMC 64]
MYAEEGGARTPIVNPGDEYDDRDGTYSCRVERLEPSPKTPVPVGTVIHLTIVCRADEEQPGGGGEDDGTGGTDQEDGTAP